MLSFGRKHWCHVKICLDGRLLSSFHPLVFLRHLLFKSSHTAMRKINHMDRAWIEYISSDGHHQPPPRVNQSLEDVSAQPEGLLS